MGASAEAYAPVQPMATTFQSSPEPSIVQMNAGTDPYLQTAGYITLAQVFLWGALLIRWLTFSSYAWEAVPFELNLATVPGITAYLFYGGLFAVDLVSGIGLLRGKEWARVLGIVRNSLVAISALVYYGLTHDFYSAAIILALAGLLLVLELRHAGWSLAFPAAFWVLIFFLLPMLIVFIVSLGDRSRLGTVIYPPFDITNPGVYFDDYARFFTRINGDLIYLRIFWRSIVLATSNTVICLAFGYPFAYWIARRPAKYRGVLILLVMIPFWTNFLVRTYAWMLILRDSGLINSFWTSTLHEQAVALAGQSSLFASLANMTATELPLLFTPGAVFLGLFYGYLPFMVLPLYSNLEQLDWSLLEAASDLGANNFRRFMRVMLPLTMPGIVAGCVIVFIPSLGAYVTPDLLGGGKVSLLGNLLQQQFMTVRDWPFGSAIGFLMMALMLIGVLIYFRTLSKSETKPI